MGPRALKPRNHKGPSPPGLTLLNSLRVRVRHVVDLDGIKLGVSPFENCGADNKTHKGRLSPQNQPRVDLPGFERLVAEVDLAQTRPAGVDEHVDLVLGRLVFRPLRHVHGQLVVVN